jgi:hypothetical protein
VLRGDGNITEDSRGSWYCSKHNGITEAAALVMGASLIHFGAVSVLLQAAGPGVSTAIQIGDANGTGIQIRTTPPAHR